MRITVQLAIDLDGPSWDCGRFNDLPEADQHAAVRDDVREYVANRVAECALITEIDGKVELRKQRS